MTYSTESQRGWHDYRAGFGFPLEYDAWSEPRQRNYENGRQRAANYQLAFGSLPRTHVTPARYKLAADIVGPAFYSPRDPHSIVPLWASSAVRG